MVNIYIFGVTPFAEMLRYYISEYSDDVFKGFVVDEKYLPEGGMLKGEEVLSWNIFLKNVSRDSCKILSSVTYNSMNSAREIVFNRIKKAGYELATFVHPTASISSNCKMGEGNIILENVTLQPFVIIGNNNVIWSNVNICHHTNIGDYNFFAASSVVLGRVSIGNKCFVGCNSTIKNDVKIDNSVLIGANAFVHSDLADNSVMVPNRSILLEKKSIEMKI